MQVSRRTLVHFVKENNDQLTNKLLRMLYVVMVICDINLVNLLTMNETTI
jgi:hypothetical protein